MPTNRQSTSRMSSLLSVMTEDQPLLQTRRGKAMQNSFFTPLRRMLIVVFALSFAFGLTATPILYAYRTLSCEEYYRGEREFEGKGDGCAVPEVQAEAAKAISVMVTVTTIGGVLNLLTTGYLQRNYGVKLTIINQTLWPILRNVGMLIGLKQGGKAGVVWFQVSQSFVALGGGAGYLLSANSFVGAVVEPKDRTGSFGQLQGAAMAGTALAFTVGGLLNDSINQYASFLLTLILLLVCTFLSSFLLPYVSPKQTESTDPASPDEKKKRSRKGKARKAKKGLKQQVVEFFKPLRVFKRRRLEDWNGASYWGVMLLAVGTFISVLATAYVPLMLQLISTNNYGFRPTENGYLMSTFAVVRATFLTFAFPPIIDYGRKWYASSARAGSRSGNGRPLGPSRGASYESTYVSYTNGNGGGKSNGHQHQEEEDDARSINSDSSAGSNTSSASSSSSEHSAHGGFSKDSEHHAQFDLDFLRWSCVLDGVLTGVLTWSGRGWEMYIAGAILPLASAAAPTAKGIVMEMVTPSEKADALGGIALIELLATVICQSVFGGLFAALSSSGGGGDGGRVNWIFLVNGGTALLSAVVLLFCRLPPSPEEIETQSEIGTIETDA